MLSMDQHNASADMNQVCRDDLGIDRTASDANLSVGCQWPLRQITHLRLLLCIVASGTTCNAWYASTSQASHKASRAAESALTNETSVGREQQGVTEDQQLWLLLGLAPPPDTHTGSLSLCPQSSYITLAPVQATQQNAQHHDEDYHAGGRPLQPKLL